MRAHYQCAIWKQAIEDPPDVDPCDYGWMKDQETKMLKPSYLPSSIQTAPDYVLKLVCCSCASENPCRSKSCGNNAAKLTCTVFGQCQVSVNCHNEETKNVENEYSEEEQL